MAGAESVEMGVGGEVAADFAFDEAEDEQGQADHGDQGGDPPVVVQEHRGDGEGSFDGGVAAFYCGLAFVTAQDLAGVGFVGVE